MRRLRTLFFAVVFAALGAVAGRMAGQARRRQAAGEAPRLDLDHINLRPRDVLPGVVAAMRVTSRPWSWLHIPPWLAAFSVNFAIGAFAGELGALTGAGGDVDDRAADEAVAAWSPAAEPAPAESAPRAGDPEPATPDRESTGGNGFTAFAQ